MHRPENENAGPGAGVRSWSRSRQPLGTETLQRKKLAGNGMKTRLIEWPSTTHSPGGTHGLVRP